MILRLGWLDYFCFLFDKDFDDALENDILDANHLYKLHGSYAMVNPTKHPISPEVRARFNKLFTECRSLEAVQYAEDNGKTEDQKESLYWGLMTDDDSYADLLKGKLQ